MEPFKFVGRQKRQKTEVENQTTTERGVSSATVSCSKNNLKQTSFPHNTSKLSWQFSCRTSKGDANMNERSQSGIHDDANMICCEHRMNQEIDNTSSDCRSNKMMKEMEVSFSSQEIEQDTKIRTESEKFEDPAFQVERLLEKSTEASVVSEEQKEAAFDTTCELTHMTWDEVMREAELLGVPLRRSVSGLRLNCERPSSSTESRLRSSTVKGQETPSLEGKRVKDKFKTSSCLRKGALSNLCTWLDNLSSLSQRKATAAAVKRQQHISYPSDHQSSAVHAASSSVVHQRRSLSASSTFRSSRRSNGCSGHKQKPIGSLCFPSPTSSSTPRQSSSLSRDISASGSRDSTSSFLSTSMLVSPSSGSLCSVFSRSSRESVHVTTKMVPTSGELSMGETLPVSSRVAQRRSESPATYTTSSSSSSILKSPSQSMSNCGNEQRSNMDQLKQCRWYWGTLNWETAVQILTDVPDGAFLLRDSQDERFIFSLSFRSQGAVHHSRIDHHKGDFSFASSERALSSSSVLELVQKGVTYCRHHPYLYCLNPRSPGTSPIPVRLLFPVNKSVSPSSLQSLCQLVVDGQC